VGHGVSPALVTIADAGRRAGLGHLSRAGAVAVALARRDVATRCLACGVTTGFERDGLRWEPLASLDTTVAVDAGAVLADGYTLGTDRLEEIAATVPLAVMDDSGSPPSFCSLAIDAAAEDADLPPLLGGPSYACLRPDFWDLERRLTRDEIVTILVATGGGDVGRVAEAAVTAAREVLPRATICVVRGPYATGSAPAGVGTLEVPVSLACELKRADLAVVTGGQTVLEATCSGVPTIAIPVTENQRRTTRRLARLGAVKPVEARDVSALAETIASLGRDHCARRALAERARDVVDGNGARRVADWLKRLIDGELPPRGQAAPGATA